MNRWIVLTPLLVLVLLTVLFAGYGLRHDPHVDPDALVGKRFPALALPSIDGGPPTSLNAHFKGPTFVNVFFSTCVPCAVEAPALAAMRAQGARIVGVAYKEDPAASKGFLARYGDPFTTVLVDRDGRASIEMGVSGAPETFLVGRDGTVLAKHSGALLPETAEAMLERASRDAAGAPG